MVASASNAGLTTLLELAKD